MWKTLAEKLRLPRIELGIKNPSEAQNYSPLVTFSMIVVPMLVLMGIGLLMAFSSQAVLHISDNNSPYLAFAKPLMLLVFALIAGSISSVFAPETYRRFATVFWVASLLLQILVATPLGASEGGNTNWIHIPGIPFLIQPSELLKLTTIIVLAQWIAHPGTRMRDWRQILILAGVPIGVSAIDVMIGHDLGTTMVLVASCIGALIITGIPKKWFVVIFSIVTPVVTAYVLQNPTRVTRILAVLPGFRPERDLSAPEQIDHSLWAFGSGGIFGLGPGASREKWKYLQAAHTDFILAIIGEEFGLLGSVIVVGALLMMVLGMIRLAHHVDSLFEAMVVAGVATWIGVQSFINIATVTSLGPVIGVPLPFVSSGGSSLIFTTLAMGVIVSIARHDAGLTWKKRQASGVFGRDPRVLPAKRSRRS